MRKHGISFAVAGILLAALLVFSACSEKIPTATEPGTDLSAEWELETAQESKLIKVGMDYTEAIEVLDAAGIKHFRDAGCVFFEEPDGRNAVAYEGENGTVSEIDLFPRVETTEEAFSSVKEGMPLSELVRTVGLPIASRTFGVDSLYFECADGTGYDVFLMRYDPKANDHYRYVYSVKKTPA